METDKLIIEMKKFKTTNIYFHSGDLLEHSIWTALYIQYVFESKSKIISKIEPTYRQLLVASGLLHDIGKMVCQNNICEYSYFNQENHPEYGYTCLYEGKIPIENGLIDLQKVLIELNITSPINNILFFLVRYHWDFGRYLRDNLSPKEVAEWFIEIYKDMKMTFIEIHILFNLLFILWEADIKATQPYNNKLNYLLDYPYISNHPRKHTGADKYTQFKVDTKGYKLFEEVMKILTL